MHPSCGPCRCKNRMIDYGQFSSKASEKNWIEVNLVSRYKSFKSIKSLLKLKIYIAQNPVIWKCVRIEVNGTFCNAFLHIPASIYFLLWSKRFSRMVPSSTLCKWFIQYKINSKMYDSVPWYRNYIFAFAANIFTY